jgi:hypothetical protein
VALTLLPLVAMAVEVAENAARAALAPADYTFTIK